MEHFTEAIPRDWVGKMVLVEVTGNCYLRKLKDFGPHYIELEDPYLLLHPRNVVSICLSATQPDAKPIDYISAIRKSNEA